MKKMKDLPFLDRPQEKIARKGASALKDEELIEAIIGRGTKNRDVRTIAREICGLIGERKTQLRYEELASLEGSGPTKASQILACFELGRRYYATPGSPAKVTKPEDILPLVPDLGSKRQEHFICTTLNGAGEVLGTGSSPWVS